MRRRVSLICLADQIVSPNAGRKLSGFFACVSGEIGEPILE
jgi:hypothetical protein